MNTGIKEAEFRKIFAGLDETGQNRLMDTACALSFAAKCPPQGKDEAAGNDTRKQCRYGIAYMPRGAQPQKDMR